MKSKNIKYGLFVLVMLVLLLPMMQHNLKLFKVAELHGAYSLPEEPVFSLKSFYNGSFQTEYNDYLEHHIGFRPFFVRLNNQISYSVFKNPQARSVVVGKDNYLFEENYIKAYLGRDFQGEEALDLKILKLKKIQDTLHKLGVRLFTAFAPGKATFFPEFIPDEYNTDEKTISNYEYLKTGFSIEGVDYIDFNQYFVDMKDTSSYPLYPQCGIHWSAIGVARAMDSLIHYMEGMSGKDMPDISWKDVELTDKLRKPDYDIGQGLNLLFKLPAYPMAYPRLIFEKDSSLWRPSVITIADSYYWNIHGRGISQRIYSKDKFWYYFKQAHGNSYESGTMVSDLNLQEEVETADFIIILTTDANLYKYAFGFIDQLYEVYFPVNE